VFYEPKTLGLTSLSLIQNTEKALYPYQGAAHGSAISIGTTHGLTLDPANLPASIALIPIQGKKSFGY